MKAGMAGALPNRAFEYSPLRSDGRQAGAGRLNVCAAHPWHQSLVGRCVSQLNPHPAHFLIRNPEPRISETWLLVVALPGFFRQSLLLQPI